MTNLLDMTRIEAGVFAVHRAPVAPAQLVKEAVAAMGPTLEGLKVVVDVASSLPEVDVDALLVGQVIINLLDNAARHSPERGVIMVTGSVAGATVSLAVSDQGPGIAPEMREAVFDRFTRLAGGGTGLGLTIARTFVEAHGSRVWYEDAPGGGARFVVELPVARFDAGEPRWRSVLVIDDDPSLLRALRLGLEAGGHDVATAATGGEGLAMAATASPRSSSSTSGCPTSTASRSAGGCAASPRSRSSCSAPTARRTARWPPWTAAPTTT